MDVLKDLDKYAQNMEQYRHVLQDAKENQGQHPRVLKHRNLMLVEFMLTSAAIAERTGGKDKHLLYTSFVPPAYPPCIAPLDDLEPILIVDLRLETHHRGRCLLLRAITTPYRMTGTIVLAEDESGEVTSLQLYQQEDEASRPANDAIEKGLILLIKEPFFKIAASGDYTLRVDHLSDVVFLFIEDMRTPASWRPRLIEILPGAADTLKREGNELVGKGEYSRAIDKYSEALTHSPTPDEIEVIKRNRSLAYLKTKQYDAALSDTGFPDFGEQAPEKALFRAAEALYHLSRYDECRQVLGTLRELYPNNNDAVAALACAQRRCDESSTGKFDFKLLQAEAKKLRPPHLDHATYVGPAEVREVEGKGRGLFTTKPVKVGDLVLCEKAFSHAHVDEKQQGNASTTVLINVETDNSFMGGEADLIRMITQRLFKNPSLATAFTDLYHGDYETVDTKFIDGQPVVDTFLAERIMALNVFGCPVSTLQVYQDVIANKAVKETEYLSCGIWIKASYINHSCLGNVRRSFIGDMLIIRAAEDLDVGTELTFQYSYPNGIYTPEADQKFKSWGFVCECPLCKDMKNTQPVAVKKRRSLKEQLDKLCKILMPGSDVTKKAERLLKELHETYMRPVEEVPRLLLWHSQLLLTRIYRSQPNLTKGLESIGNVLHILGFVITGLDRTSAAFVITQWGHTVDHLVEVFLHARSAFEQLGLGEKSKQADEYARVAYRVVVGEDASFERTYPGTV